MRENSLLQRLFQPMQSLAIGLLNFFSKIIIRCVIGLRKIESKTSDLVRYLSPVAFDEKRQRVGVVASTQYNMRLAPGESYYAAQYWENFREYLPQGTSPLVIADLGCGQGRFTFDFAERYPDAQITGIDISPSAINDAKHQLDIRRLTNVKFVCSSIEDSIKTIEDESIDILIFTEVTIYDPGWRESLYKLLGKVKPGALIVASFRSTYFNTLLLTADQRLGDADRIVNSRQGPLWGQDSVQFSWNNASELVHEFEDIELEILTVVGIGSCSGIVGDPHANVVKPWELSKADQNRLMRIELEMGKVVPDAGRYILLVARKSRIWDATD